MHLRSALATALAVGAIVSLAGCSSAATSDSSASSTSTGASNGVIRVVASTDVWGNIAATIGGKYVNVTSIIDDPDKDPHEYEADAQTQLALSKANVVIENGGGYDDFVEKMLASTSNTGMTKINAVTVSGKKAAAGEELNEHVWYDFPTVQKVVARIEKTFATHDPAHTAAFSKNADSLTAEIGTLITREKAIAAADSGEGVSITEPVPLYLLEAMGLDNKTPEKFSAAIESDTDVAPDVLLQTLALYTGHDVKLLAYNEQTTGAQTEAVLKAAKANSIAVVPVTETLPKGDSYLTWMTKNVDAIEAALR